MMITLGAKLRRFMKSTLIRYFLSYFLIITVFILCFFFINKRQLLNRTMTQNTAEMSRRISAAARELTTDISFLTKTSDSLKKDMMLLSLNGGEGTLKDNRFRIYQELLKYSECTPQIGSVVYKASGSKEVMSTQYSVSFEEDGFHIIDAERGTLIFDPSPYLDSYVGSLVIISNENISRIIYFPVTHSLDGAVIFFLLDTSYIQKTLSGLVSEEIPTVGLMDQNRRIAAGINTGPLLQYADALPEQSGIYQPDRSTSIYVYRDLVNGFSIIAIQSSAALSERINQSFWGSYVWIIGLSTIGFLLLVTAMRFTYVPLHRLTKILLPGTDHRQEYLTLLQTSFEKNTERNRLLNEKLENYRISMQKSLFESILIPSDSGEKIDAAYVDRLFEPNPNKEIFVIQMMASSGILPYAELPDFFNRALPGGDACRLLSVKEGRASFLINYTGVEPAKHDVLLELLHHLHQKKGYLSALSESADTASAIPALYENSLRVSLSWPQEAVADSASIYSAAQHSASNTASRSYPQADLERLSCMLVNRNYSQAHALIDILSESLNHYAQNNGELSDFFIRCVLIDMLSCIINCINNANIPFASYEDLYTETLFFCRSTPYRENADRIVTSLHGLVNLYQQELDQMALTPGQVINLLKENFADPDCSITMLADKCHISIAYMSYLIKKELDQNFSDFLWSLRLEKAKELLSGSDASIDEISIAVGYLNTSSFRRKFKQETGLTPSQWRQNNRKKHNI